MTKCRQYNAGQFHFLGEFFLATDVGNDDLAHSCTTFPCYLGMEINADVGNDDQERGGGVLRRDGPRFRRQVHSNAPTIASA